MSQRRNLFTEQEFTVQERELNAIEAQIIVNKKIQASVRQRYELLSDDEKATNKGLAMEYRIATLELKIIRLEESHKNKSIQYKDYIYYREKSCSPFTLLGRVLCITAIVVVIITGFIISFGG